MLQKHRVSYKFPRHTIAIGAGEYRWVGDSLDMFFPLKTKKDTQIERIEKEMRKLADELKEIQNETHTGHGSFKQSC